ncbi:MAG: recombination protein RecR [Bacteroidales bacterium]|jgi:recombination protein RecR|nr:recombination protein RecR [Bacteroidales bacterium]
MQKYSSKILENAINQIGKLPGIGHRTAVRLTLFLLKQPKEEVKIFTESIDMLRNNISFCHICHNISDGEECEICSNPSRDKSMICVVQDIRDVLAIENTNVYKGVYHVLNGVISPIEGIGVADLNIDSLLQRLEKESVAEIFMALPATTEGDTTAYYISKHIKTRFPQIKVTAIARGVSVGNELENTDEITLARSIVHRVEFESTFK